MENGKPQEEYNNYFSDYYKSKYKKRIKSYVTNTVPTEKSLKLDKSNLEKKTESEIIQNMKDILHETELLKKKFLKGSKSFTTRKKNYIQDKTNKSVVMKKNDIKLEENLKDDNFTESKHIDYLTEENDDNSCNYNFIRSNLMESYIKIWKENRLLENEIENYSGKKENENLINKEFESLKNSFKNTITENKQLFEKIFKIQEINKLMKNKIKQATLDKNEIFKNLEDYNRKKAEIQIMNEENEGKLNKLFEDRKILLKDIKTLQFQINELKSKRKSRIISHNSSSKNLKDIQELINKLSNNKNKLEKELNVRKEYFNKRKNILIKNKNKINFYNNIINNLLKEIRLLQLNKTKLLQNNSNLKSNINTNEPSQMNQINRIKLNKIYENVKAKIFEKKRQIKIEEQNIENMKRNIDIFSQNPLNNNVNGNPNIYQNNTLDYQIRLEEQKKKDLQIRNNKINNYYKKLINEKETLILRLQNELMKKGNVIKNNKQNNLRENQKKITKQNKLKYSNQNVENNYELNEKINGQIDQQNIKNEEKMEGENEEIKSLNESNDDENYVEEDENENLEEIPENKELYYNEGNNEEQEEDYNQINEGENVEQNDYMEYDEDGINELEHEGEMGGTN